MITINAHVSKKVPIEGRDYSSESYSAGMECEGGSPEMLYVQRTNPLWTSCSVGGGSPTPRGGGRKIDISSLKFHLLPA